MKKAVIWISGALAAVGLAFIAAVKTMPYFAPLPYGSGDLLFAGAEDATRLTVTVNGRRIKLKKQEGSWFVDDYYACNRLIEDFLQKLGRAVLLSCSNVAAQPENEVRLKVHDSVSFDFETAPAPDPAQSIVRLEGKEYLISENLLLPSDLSAYYLQPLLPLQNHQIEQVAGLADDQVDLSGLRYREVRRALPEGDKAAYDYRSFAVVTADGLKLICGVYKHRDRYWMTVQLKTTIMPTAEADRYAKENSFRYDGWYFLLADADGSRLYKSLTGN